MLSPLTLAATPEVCAEQNEARKGLELRAWGLAIRFKRFGFMVQQMGFRRCELGLGFKLSR